MSNRITLGVLVKAHGILGELLVKYHAESVELLYNNILLGITSKSAVPVVITNTRYNRDKLLIRIQGVTTRTEAEKLRGYFLFIDEDNLPPPSEGEIYRVKLLGLSIYSDAGYIGVLEDIQDISGQEIWSIRSQSGKEILFPAVDKFIVSMDLDKEKIYINPPHGLLDIYLE